MKLHTVSPVKIQNNVTHKAFWQQTETTGRSKTVAITSLTGTSMKIVVGYGRDTALKTQPGYVALRLELSNPKKFDQLRKKCGN
jgi:hypothetical protein